MAGENLVRNGGFEEVGSDGKSPLGWSLAVGDHEAVQWQLTPDSHSGRRGVLAESPGSGSISVASSEFEVKPRSTYAMSVWARSDKTADLNIQFDFDSHSAGISHFDARPKIGSEWKQVTGIVPSFPESSTCTVHLRARGVERLFLDEVHVSEVDGNPWFKMCEKTSLSQLRLSPQRPCLYFSEGDLQSLKALIEKEAWAKRNAASILADADERLSRGPYEVPVEVLPTVGEVQEIRRHVPKSLGMAYGLTGDVRYAQKAREALLYLNEIRPEGGLGRRAGEYGYTCGYAAASSAMLYDMVYGSGVFSVEDRQKVESLLRASFDGMRLHQDNTKFHNRAAVCLGAMGAIAFCLQDTELIDWVVNGPYGFHRHMAAVPEDGLWEEGPSYAFMTFGHMGQGGGYVGVAEGAYHAGINLYEEPNLNKLLLTPMNYAFPDMTMSGHGHAGSGDSVVDRASWFVRPYLRTGDRRYGWVLREAYGIRDTGRSRSLWDGAVEVPTEVDYVPEFGTTHFASRGLVMLRTGVEEKAINVLFDYGYTGGHAHPDKMNIALYANGQVQAPDGILLYTVPEAFTYNGQPVGHNTVVVDERCQHPAESQTLRTLLTGGKAQIADAEDTEAYDGVHLRRTVILTGSYVVDFFKVSGEKPHRYDWVYHNLGEMRTDLPLKPHRGSLGMKNGYNHVLDVSKYKTDGPWQVLCRLDGQKADEAVLVQMPGGDLTEVTLGTGRGVFRLKPDEDMPVLLARRFCESTVYTATIEPYRGQPRIQSVERLEASRTGKAVDATTATGLRVATEDGEDTYLMAYDEGPCTFGGVELDGEILALSVDGDGGLRYLQAVKSSSVKAGDLSLTTPSTATVYLEQTGPGSYLVENQGEEEAVLSLAGLHQEAPVVCALDAAGMRGEKVTCTLAGTRLTFSAAPKVRYEITGE